MTLAFVFCIVHISIAEEIASVREKALAGDAVAQNQLGEFYVEGKHGSVDYKEAFKWFQKAAKQRNPTGEYNLGGMYWNGRGVSKDYGKAVEWMHRSAAQALPEAHYHLYVAYALGLGVPQSDETAVKHLKESAELGSTEGQWQLGSVYLYGHLLPKDESQANKWFRKAAETDHKDADSGNAEAQYRLGKMHAEGWGVEQNHEEAAKYFRMAAMHGHTSAQMRMAEAFAEGRGVPKDHAESARWYEKAAVRGEVSAQYHIAGAYAVGRGVKKDPEKAFDWYRKSAEQDLASAQFALGVTYLLGTGAPKNASLALRWFRRSANQGDTDAQYLLGLMYTRGNGVTQDDTAAYMWFLIAAAKEHEKAREQAARLESRLGVEDRSKGQKMARQWKPSYGNRATVSVQEIIASQPAATGSGFFISSDGYLITNQHVVEDGSNFRVRTKDGNYEAVVVRVDPVNDIALLKVKGNFDALPIVSSRWSRIGDKVVSVGFPNPGLQGFSPKYSEGSISSLSGVKDDVRNFQISVPVQPGNSGGALVNSDGNVVGVVTAKLSQRAALKTTGTIAENVNYAVKSSYVLSFLEAVPEIVDKLTRPNSETRDSNLAERVTRSAALILVY